MGTAFLSAGIASRLFLGLATVSVLGCSANGSDGAKAPEQAQVTDPPAGRSLTGEDNAESDRARAALAARLPEVKLDNVELHEVLNFLADVSHQNFAVHWSALEAAGVRKQARISLYLKNVPISAVLENVLSEAGGGKINIQRTIRNGIVTIGTFDTVEPEVQTRVFDIRDLLVTIPDFVPPSRPTAGAQTLYGGNDTQQQVDPRQERVDELIALIQDTVSPDTWKDNGGSLGSLRELSGQLIVVQTPENHVTISKLLTQVRQARSIQIDINAKIIAVDQDRADTITAPLSWNVAAKEQKSFTAFATPEQIAAFMENAKKESATTIAAPRVTLFNGQRGFVKTGSPQSYVAGYTVIKDDKGSARFTPYMNEVESGVILDVEPTTSQDNTNITLTLRPEISILLGMTSEPFEGNKEATIQKPQLEKHQFQMAASVPSGQSLIVRAGGDNGKRALFLIVTPTVIVDASGK